MLNAAIHAVQTEPAPIPREQQAESLLKLAQQLISCTPRRGNFPIPARLKTLKEFFETAYLHFEETNKTQVAVSHVAEWLLDNFYVLEQAIRQLEEDLPVDYYQRLPQTNDGWTRIYILALGITRWDDSRIDIERIKNLTQTFQSVTPLRVGELWALPLMLRLTVLETLAEGLADVTKLKWEILSQPAIWQKIKTTNSELVAEENYAQGKSESMVVNSILNLRLLATQDWKEFFETTSVLEKTLRNDPENIYSQMDFETRNHYRGIIEELGFRSPVSEADIASQVVEFAQTGSGLRDKHVGYYLIGPGRAQLETAIKYQPGLF